MSSASSTSPPSSPTQGESAVGLLSQAPAANNDMRATKDDFLYLDPAAFPADFAADVPPAQANFMARSQQMLAKAAGGAPVTTAAWHQKKSWALVATRDHNINPDLERNMAKRAGSETIEVDRKSTRLNSSHVSQSRMPSSA